MQNFTVSICVYHKDNAKWFQEAIESVTIKQTIKPNEVIVVVDGPIYGELECYVNSLEKNEQGIRVIRLPQNLGHAGARQIGLKASSNNLIAIMDADDISVPNRFERQLKEFENNPDIAIAGGQICEFIGNQSNIVGKRIVPESDDAIKKYLKSRCPMNLVTVMYKKQDIEAVGGFVDWYCEEDYFLWIRLVLGGYKFINLRENLVNVRVGNEMYQRRGGWKYFKSEARLQHYMFQHGMITIPRYCYNVLGRFIIQVMLPNRLRGFIFQRLFRKK